MKKCAAMAYHYGLRLRLYPSNLQKQIISHNANAARFVYNRCVAIGRELYELRKTKIYIEPVHDRIDFLESQFKISTGMSNMAPFLYCDDIDSQAKDNAIKNYNAAWNMYRKVPGTSVPTFHKKSYEESYQTNAHYKPGDHSVKDGSGVKFLDKTHVSSKKNLTKPTAYAAILAVRGKKTRNGLFCFIFLKYQKENAKISRKNQLFYEFFGILKVSKMK